jgi:hypothetical protein
MVFNSKWPDLRDALRRFGMLTCVILGKRFGYCNYSHISFTARIITTAAFRTSTGTDAAVARALLQALMPPRCVR